MPQLRLDYGEDWKERFAREQNAPRRIGAFWGLLAGVILTIIAIYVLGPWLASVDWRNIFTPTIG
jgi:hypothetical protein